MRTIKAIAMMAVLLSVMSHGYMQPIIKTFGNGLTVATIHDPNATVASAYVFVRTGSLFEGQWMGAGLSHYLEHLISAGTTKMHSEKKYQTLISELGGASNAYTTYDHTAYYIKSSSKNIPKAIRALHEWMFHADWTNEEYEREKGVIIKEMERANSNMGRQIYQHAQTLFYKDSPYRYPVIGFYDVFMNTTSDDLKAYYKWTYVPENMVVVVGGNIASSNIMQVIKSTFGEEKKYAAPIRLHSNERRQMSPSKTSIMMDQLKTKRILIRYPIVSFYHDDVYPLDLLAYVLGHGDQSILYQEFVVKRKMATQIDVKSITPTYDTGYFEIMIESNQKENEVIQAIQTFINQLEWKRLKKKTLTKAVAQKKAEYILDKSSLDQHLKEIGQAMMMGQDPLFFEFYSKNFDHVSFDDIRRVIKTYLNEKRRQTYVFNSKDKNQEMGLVRKEYPVNIEDIEPGIQLIKIKESNPNIVKITVHMTGGISKEGSAVNGIGHLSSKLIGKKIKGLSRKKYQNSFEEKGASIGASLSHNSLTYSMISTTEDSHYLATLFAKGLSEFDVDESLFNEVKNQTLKEISKKPEDWFNDAFDQVKTNVVSKKSMYSLPITGSTSTVEALSINDVKQYIKQRLSNSKIVVVIQASQPEVLWDKIKKHMPLTPRQTLVDLPSVLLNNQRQFNLTLAQPVGVVMRIDPIDIEKMGLKDYLTLQLVDAVLSGMRYPSGLLHQRLRGDQLVYVVHTVHMKWGQKNMLFTYALTDQENVQKATDVINDAFNEIKTNISTEQLYQAKNQVLFNFQNTRQNMVSKVSDMIYHAQTFGRIASEEAFEKELNDIDIDDLQLFINTKMSSRYVIQFNSNDDQEMTR